MADNLVADPGSGGATFATDDIGGVHFPRTKIAIGADGANDGDVSSANPLPVAAAALPLPTGAATSALQTSSEAILTTMDADTGNIATNTGAATTALQIMDDWDESDRAKVNIIPSQVGITAGAGSVAANTPRVTHASDDPVTTAVQLIDDIVYTDDTSTHATGTSKGALFMAAATPTDSAVNANDIGAVAMTVDRKLHVSVQDALPAGANSIGAVTYATTGSGNATGALRVELPTNGTGVIATVGAVTAITNALPTGANTIGAVTYATTGSGNATGALRVELPTNGTGVIATVGAVTAITNALPAGTNAIGKLAANSGVDIGDVDVTSLVPGVAATSLGKAVDNPAGTTDTGVAVLLVRDDSLSTLGVLDGDYTHGRTDSQGAQWVHLTSSSVTLTATQADDAAFGVSSSVVLPVGYLADEASTDSVDEGDAGIARMTLDRKQIVTIYGHPSAGGALPFKNLDVDETEDDVKTSPGKLFWLHVMNLASAKRYLKIYNATAANVTVGTTTPVHSFPLPTQGDTNGAGFTIHFGDMGQFFDTAICIAATTGIADNDTGAPSTNDVVVNGGYI